MNEHQKKITEEILQLADNVENITRSDLQAWAAGIAIRACMESPDDK